MKDSNLKKSIVLFGPSGVGKSLIATELSKRLGIQRVCIDDIYEYVAEEIDLQLSDSQKRQEEYKRALMQELEERRFFNDDINAEYIEAEELLVQRFIDEYNRYNELLGGLKSFHSPAMKFSSASRDSLPAEFNAVLSKLTMDFINIITESVDEPLIFDVPMAFGFEAPKSELSFDTKFKIARKCGKPVSAIYSDTREFLSSVNPVLLTPSEDYYAINSAKKVPQNEIILKNLDGYVAEGGVVVTTNRLFFDSTNKYLKRRAWFDAGEYLEKERIKNRSEISNICDEIVDKLEDLNTSEL